jgi:hypothetical protein
MTTDWACCPHCPDDCPGDHYGQSCGHGCNDRTVPADDGFSLAALAAATAEVVDDLLAGVPAPATLGALQGVIVDRINQLDTEERGAATVMAMAIGLQLREGPTRIDSRPTPE